MTAQVFLKLSSKLAAEQGLVDGLDGTMDFGHGVSSYAVYPGDATLDHADKPRLSRSARRALSSKKTLRNGSREKYKKNSNDSSASGTM
jgi:hypothetical protein